MTSEVLLSCLEIGLAFYSLKYTVIGQMFSLQNAQGQSRCQVTQKPTPQLLHTLVKNEKIIILNHLSNSYLSDNLTRKVEPAANPKTSNIKRLNPLIHFIIFFFVAQTWAYQEGTYLSWCECNEYGVTAVTLSSFSLYFWIWGKSCWPDPMSVYGEANTHALVYISLPPVWHD